MIRKRIVPILIVSIFCSLVSCYTMKQENSSILLDSGRSRLRIFALTKVTGDTITFKEDYPGRVEGEMVVGVRHIQGKKTLDRENIESMERIDTGITRIITKEGRTYAVSGYQENDDTVIIDQDTEEFVAIPITDIKRVMIKTMEIHRGPNLFWLTVLGVCGTLLSLYLEGTLFPDCQ